LKAIHKKMEEMEKHQHMPGQAVSLPWLPFQYAAFSSAKGSSDADLHAGLCKSCVTGTPGDGTDSTSKKDDEENF